MLGYVLFSTYRELQESLPTSERSAGFFSGTLPLMLFAPRSNTVAFYPKPSPGG